MKRPFDWGWRKGVAVSLVGVTLLCGCGGQTDRVYTDSFFAMDTYMTLTLYGEAGRDGFSMARQELMRLDELLAAENETGQVAKLNREKELKAPEEVEKLWGESLALYRQTNGAFDATIYPVMQAWGFADGDYRIPGEKELEAMLPKVDSSRVVWDEENHILTLTEDMELDFGGIAKGYAGERLAWMLKQNHVESALLDLGGNIQLIGGKPDGSDFRIGIRNPLDENSPLGILSASDVAIVTSGGYERYFERDGVRYHHIIDPRTGYPADSNLLSVTIVSGSGTLADGYSTAMYVLGEGKAIQFWREHGDSFQMVLLTCDGVLYVTEGLEGRFTTDQEVKVLRKDS